MTSHLEEQTRVELHHLTEEVVGGPDLTTSLTRGRTRRRRRAAVAGVAALALTGSLGALVVGQLQRSGDVVQDPSFATSPTYPDFVPGTQIDEDLQGVVATYLPRLGTASDVFPGDWNTVGPLPDSQWANATEWQATYTVDRDETMSVDMGKKVPGARVATCRPGSHRLRNGQPACLTTTLHSGATVTSTSFALGSTDHGYVFTDYLVRPDGTSVTVTQKVTASSWRQADRRRGYGRTDLLPLLSDPSLTFPDPVVAPAPPTASVPS
jgi:hypothetical protein